MERQELSFVSDECAFETPGIPHLVAKHVLAGRERRWDGNRPTSVIGDELTLGPFSRREVPGNQTLFVDLELKFPGQYGINTS